MGRVRVVPVGGAAGVVVGLVLGPGGDFAEEPVFRCEPVTLATETFLECPARARWSVARETLGVGHEMAPHDVAESRRLSARIASRRVLPSASLRS